MFTDKKNETEKDLEFKDRRIDCIFKMTGEHLEMKALPAADANKCPYA